MAQDSHIDTPCHLDMDTDDYNAGCAEGYADGYVEGRESLATDILLILREYPNNVTRIERIRERCNAVLGLGEPNAD